jgi:hypothetical protein
MFSTMNGLKYRTLPLRHFPVRVAAGGVCVEVGRSGHFRVFVEGQGAATEG